MNFESSYSERQQMFNTRALLSLGYTTSQSKQNMRLSTLQIDKFGLPLRGPGKFYLCGNRREELFVLAYKYNSRDALGESRSCGDNPGRKAGNNFVAPALQWIDS